MYPHPFIEIHPHDAKTLGIETEDWLEVRSRRGKARFPASDTSDRPRHCLYSHALGQSLG
jgi:ferredoxin-nitrate reductase